MIVDKEFFDFVKYVEDFYAIGGIYGEHKFMTTEIVLATGIMVERYDVELTCDSVDRERVRDIVLDELR